MTADTENQQHDDPSTGSLSPMLISRNDQVERYLRTGEHDALFCAWPRKNLFARARQGDVALRGALISLVKNSAAHVTVPKELINLDVVSFTRTKVEPMVRGLFSGPEQQAVLDVLAHSVVFLTPATIESVLNQTRYLETAWNLSNIYLASCGSKLVADDVPQLAGLSEETTCYVSMAYFQPSGRLDDFVVHEAAHIFHNCKRQTIGLPEVRGREWLLDIEFSKRETFAYCREAYSRILELGNSTVAKRELLSQVENGLLPPDERVDASEYIHVLREGTAARNGWKGILQVCAPRRKRRASSRDQA
jgi:hypothetical protein